MKNTIILIVFILQLQGCSIVSQVFLYNAREEELTLFRGGEYEESYFKIAAKSVKEISLNERIPNTFVVRTFKSSFCYQVPVISQDWVKPSWNGAIIFMVLDEKNVLYLYSPKFNKENFYKNPPSTQPSGFPLYPGRCTQE
jgi:hypothetical protein